MSLAGRRGQVLIAATGIGGIGATFGASRLLREVAPGSAPWVALLLLVAMGMVTATVHLIMLALVLWSIASRAWDRSGESHAAASAGAVAGPEWDGPPPLTEAALGGLDAVNEWSARAQRHLLIFLGVGALTILAAGMLGVAAVVSSGTASVVLWGFIVVGVVTAAVQLLLLVRAVWMMESGVARRVGKWHWRAPRR